MKTIGLIGGMTWESSLEYYRIINQTVKQELEGFHSARIIMYSVDFEEIERLIRQDNWEELAKILIDAGHRVEKGGAELVLLCTNTMHKVADDIQENINIPLLHIADATAIEIKKKGFQRIGLLGTRFTMEQDFYKSRLAGRFGIEAIIPENQDMEIVNDIIFRELAHGTLNVSSKKELIRIINDLAKNGAEGVILGCTEIPLLIRQEDTSVPLFVTTMIHARYAVAYALDRQ